jgi:hypothetical protein
MMIKTALAKDFLLILSVIWISSMRYRNALYGRTHTDILPQRHGNCGSAPHCGEDCEFGPLPGPRMKREAGALPRVLRPS